MLFALYSVLIFKYKLAAWLYSFVNTKANKRITSLKDQQSSLVKKLSKISNNRILIHCASLGEYEQATPIINWALDNTDLDIVVSFFSPSGYENCELPNSRCIKCYLPFDLKSDMESYIDKINPTKVIITKNEWWWNMLHVLKSRRIPTYLTSSTVRNNHYFIKYPLSFFKNGLSAFNSIFVLNKESENSLSKIYDGKIFIAGDTRVDQVLAIKAKSTSLKTIKPVIIHGSVWLNDLTIIKEIIEQSPDYNHFVYPHNLTNENVDAFCFELGCESKKSISGASGTVIINSMGQLKKDYSIAQMAYIGGGFGDGIHNILEAAVYNIPTVFGPRFQKSEEAKDLIDLEVAYSVSEKSQLNPIISKLLTIEYQEKVNLKLIDYFSASKSATEIICTEIFN